MPSNFYAGFDTSIYPGDKAMEWLWNNTNLKWAGFYLGPAPHHPDKTWMPTYGRLKSIGWGLAPLYVGQQLGRSGLITPEQGKSDANQAALLAGRAQLPVGSTLYLDIEMGGLLPGNLVQYYQAWSAQLKTNHYKPGVYCSYAQTASQLTAVQPAPVWTWHIGLYRRPAAGFQNNYPELDPAQSGVVGATAWQLLDGITIPTDGAGVFVDLDSATMADPSKA